MFKVHYLPWIIIAGLLIYGFAQDDRSTKPRKGPSTIIGAPRAPSISSAYLSNTETLKTIRIPDNEMSDMPELDQICYVYENRTTGQSQMACPSLY